jgi:hypothetical protein
MSVYQWPWNDDDRSWIPEVLASGILWNTNRPTIDAGEGDLILEQALLKNDSPQGWNDQSKPDGSWQNADNNPSTIWNDTKRQDNEWNQT